MITSGGEVLMFYVTLTKLIFKCCFVEGGGGGGDVVGEGGEGDKCTFPMHNIPLNHVFSM